MCNVQLQIRNPNGSKARTRHSLAQLFRILSVWWERRNTDPAAPEACSGSCRGKVEVVNAHALFRIWDRHWHSDDQGCPIAPNRLGIVKDRPESGVVALRPYLEATRESCRGYVGNTPAIREYGSSGFMQNIWDVAAAGGEINFDRLTKGEYSRPSIILRSAAGREFALLSLKSLNCI